MSWIFIAISAIPVLCAILAMMGFQGRDHVVGIDLGTTYSVIGVSQRGNVTIVPDANGHVLVPSVVAFLNGSELKVGRDAKPYLVSDPFHTIFNAKRFIGRRFSDPVVQSEAALYDFKIQPNSTDENDAFVCFQLQLDGHPACVSPIDVGQMIVTHLVKQVSQFLQHDQITTAVIAVPADFNAVQRHATIKAFEKAGLRVARVLDEPTAAAVAYGLHQDPNVTYVLVYDFGGGTLDVSLLYIREGSVQVMGSAGDNRLGGEDIDQRIAEYLRKEFEAQLGQPIVSTDVADGTSDVFPCTSAGIRRAAEQVKRELSSTEFATAECVVHESTAKLERNTRLSVSLTRDAFERLCEEILTRSLIPIRRVLDDNMMDPESVDEVVLVGGSSRIPWVHRKLKEMFNGRDPHSHIDPDVAVAYGAARIVD